MRLVLGLLLLGGCVPSLASDFGGDPDITVDGTGLLMRSTGGGALMLRRTCPPPQ